MCAEKRVIVLICGSSNGVNRIFTWRCSLGRKGGLLTGNPSPYIFTNAFIETYATLRVMANRWRNVP